MVVPRGKGVGGLSEKDKGIKKYKLVVIVQNSHGDANYSTGNIANNIVITIYGTRWILKLPGETLCKVCDCLTTRLFT